MLLCVDPHNASRNALHFSLNGCWQGAAFTAFPSAAYHPAVSAYQHAQLHCRFEPPYLFAPPWQHKVSGRCMRVSWQVGLQAAASEMRYLYWKREKEQRAGQRKRTDRRRREQNLPTA